eukprot:12411697-Karenia_brevis.AAC.1
MATVTMTMKLMMAMTMRMKNAQNNFLENGLRYAPERLNAGIRGDRGASLRSQSNCPDCHDFTGVQAFRDSQDLGSCQDF